MSNLIIQTSGNITTITFNRPDSFNSFNRSMALELVDALWEAEQNTATRVIVLTGTGKAFCAGQDLKEVTNPETNIGFERIVDEHYNKIIKTIVQLSVPVIAAVNGVAAGAGANIALACDITLGSEKSSFIQAFSKIGLIPDSGGSYILPRLIGYQRAKALTMFGDKVTAEEAAQMGMIYKVLPADNFLELTMEYASKLAALPPIGISYTKQLFNLSYNNTLDQQLELEKQFQIKAGNTEDYHECVQAFIDKRQPQIKGK